MHKLTNVSLRLSYSLIFCLVLAPAGVSIADSKEQAAKLDEVRAQIRKITEKLHATQKERNSVQSELHKIEVRLAETGRSIHKLNQKIRKQERSLTVLRKRRTALDHQRLNQRDKLAEQIRAAYITGHQERLKLLLNQEDPSDLSRMMTYYSYLNQERVQIIQTAEKTLDELVLVEKDIQSQTHKLSRLQSTKKSARQKIEDERRQRNRVLAAINQSIQSQDQAITKLKTDERRIQALLQSLNNVLSDIPRAKQSYTPFHALKGKMNWPTRGVFANRFGEPRNSGDLIWRGLSIKASAGSDVKAISHGRVAFADWLQGFGLIVILDHLDGYMSLYAHNQTLLIETGDWVELGELIARVGDSGGQETSGLYFEIRHQGIPIDPTSWCKANQTAQKNR